MSGCTTVAISHGPLKEPAAKHEEKVGIYDTLSSRPLRRTGRVTTGIFGIVKWGSIRTELDIDRKLMAGVREALDQAGYDSTSIKSKDCYSGPIIKCKADKFWFNVNLWAFPVIWSSGRLQLTVSLSSSATGEIIWQKSFEEASSVITDTNDKPISVAFTAVLNRLVDAFSSEEFHEAVLKAASMQDTGSAYDYMGKVYYTNVNMWYKTCNKISVINNHCGTMLPVGTKVSVFNIDRDAMVFNKEENPDDVNFTIVKSRKYVDIEDSALFDRYFSRANPLDSEQFSKFTDEEKNNIKEGKIIVGMSREAVIEAYGYPPTDRTPNLADDTWQYRVGRASVKVIFKDNKVIELIGMKKAIESLGEHK